MKTSKMLVTIAFVLALVGGLLVLVGAVSGMTRLSLSSFLLNGFELLLALGAIFGGWLMYTGLRKMGGMMTLIAGVLILALTGALVLTSALIILGGALGIIAAEMKPWWAFWR